MQMPKLKKKYLKYESYRNQKVSDIFNEDKVANSIINKAYTLSTSVFINSDSISFSKINLPIEAQFSTTNAIHISDFNNDSFYDLLIGGNLYRVKPEVGKYDAQYGLVLLGNEKGNFTKVLPKESGLNFIGQVRDFLFLNEGLNNYLFVLNNSEKLQTYRLNQEQF